MSVWRHDVSWHGEHRWYVRAGLIVWWLGQLMFGACLGVAFAVVHLFGFNASSIDGACAALLTGFVILLAARYMLALALRRRRRRHVRVY